MQATSVMAAEKKARKFCCEFLLLLKMDFKKIIRIESSQCSDIVSKSNYICQFSLNVAEVQIFNRGEAF